MSRTQSIGTLNRQTEQISTDKPPRVDGRSSPRFVGQPELSSDTLCLTVLCELYERKTAIFRPSKLPLLVSLLRCSLVHCCMEFLAHPLYLHIFPFHTQMKNQLFMAGVHYPRQDVAPAVGQGGTCEFCAFPWTPLTHRRVDGCRPLVHAFGIGIGDDDAAH